MKSPNSSFTRHPKTGSPPDASPGWIVVFIVAMLGLATLTLLQVYAERQARENDALRLDQELVDVWHRLELGMEQRINTVEALQGFMLATRKPPDLAEFNNFAATLMRTGGGAQGYAYGDAAGVLRYFYPLAGNRNAIGLNIYRRPGASFLRKAVEERHTTVGDPVKAIQGGLSVVVRAPLFRDARLVGHVQGVFDITKLVEQASDILDSGMALQLEDAQGQVFYGPTAPLAWSRSVSVQAGDDHWRLRVAWRSGPPRSSWLTRLLIWLGGGLLLASLMYMLYRVQSQARVLARAVDERTAALQESQRTLSTLMNNLPGAVYRCFNDPNWTLEFISEGIRELTGYAPDDFVRHRRVNYADLIHPDDRDQVWRDVQAALAEKRPFQLTYRLITVDGQTKWAWERGEGVYGPSGEVLRLEGFITDISERVETEAEMGKLSSAIQQTADAVMITDRDGRIEYVNQAFTQMTGYARVEVIGRKPDLLKSELQDKEFHRRLWDTILAGGTFSDIFINRRKGGELYYEEKTISPLKDAGGRITHFIATGKDISDRMQAQARLHFLAHHDALTQLPNRVLFLDRLGQALYRGRWSERVVAVMFLDLDRFKNLNDTLGHDIGDRILHAIGTRLKGAVRDGDTVARLGGDEFAILLDEVAHTEDVATVAAKILQAFAAPFPIDAREFYLTASIGISLYPNDGADAAALLKHADTAMYRAKDMGKNNYQFYSADMSAQAFERLTLESSLRHALERNEFLLYYQPQIELASGRLVGLEALLRWQHPEFGLVGPLQFIHSAEETGLIGPIGDWVLRTACHQVRAWESQGLRLERLAVNLSGRQLHQHGFIDGMKRALADCVPQTTEVELEITESVIMKEAKLTSDRLRTLYELGVRFAIDDFGTGYSSLSYLKRFPISTLKIDKTFVQEVTTDPDDAEIVRAIITMAHSLRLKVVAEGVETEEQLGWLRDNGCDMVQGYYFSRPVTSDVLLPWLRVGGEPVSAGKKTAIRRK